MLGLMLLATSTDGVSAPPAPFNLSGPAETPGTGGWRTLPDLLPTSFSDGIQLEVIVAILIAPLILKLAARIPSAGGEAWDNPPRGSHSRTATR